MGGSPRKPAGQAKGHRRRPAVEVTAPPATLEEPSGGVVDEAPAPAVPAPPSGLGREALERWDAFWSSPVAALVDAGADGHKLKRWIIYLDEWDRATSAARRNRLVEGSTGQPVLNPLLKYIAALEASIRALEHEFGMGAKSRIDLGISVGQAALTAADLNRLIEEGDGDERGALASEVDGELLDEFEAG